MVILCLNPEKILNNLLGYRKMETILEYQIGALDQLNQVMSTTEPVKEYRKLLKTSKINNVTVKRENGKYYAVVNITASVEELEKTGASIGIDLGLKKLATLSNGEIIDNLDLKKEDSMIKKYQKKLSRQEYMSKNYKKTLKKIHKWINKKNNKIKNKYHHLSKNLVEKYDIISMETLKY